MKHLIRKCKSCSTYTIGKQCPKCSGDTTTPHPAKFSPDDRYARYRISDRYKSSS
ncbi:MAG: RNA-protein complex protein Nop10 [Nitrososphaerales archaeon]|nr:RNA-protein complex protein Nop10 [Nitrososphaerales archaeon]